MPIELRAGLSPFDNMRERRELALFSSLDLAKARLRSAAAAMDAAVEAINAADALLGDPRNADITGELADPAQTSGSVEIMTEIGEFRAARDRLVVELGNYLR